MPIAQPRRAGNTLALVGTPEQGCEAPDYYDAGVSTLLIRGFNPPGCRGIRRQLILWVSLSGS
jgi:hypothetical protein